MIQFSCRCGRRIKAPDQAAGKTATCPACKSSFVVPAGKQAPEPGRPPRRSGGSGKGWWITAGVGTAVLGVAVAAALLLSGKDSSDPKAEPQASTRKKQEGSGGTPPQGPSKQPGDGGEQKNPLDPGQGKTEPPVPPKTVPKIELKPQPKPEVVEPVPKQVPVIDLKPAPKRKVVEQASRLRRFPLWKGRLNDSEKGPDIFSFFGANLTGTAFAPDRRTLVATYSPMAALVGGGITGPGAKFDKIMEASLGGAEHIALWDLERGEEVRRFTSKEPLRHPRGPVFSADGRKVLILHGRKISALPFGDADGEICLWNPADGNLIARHSLVRTFGDFRVRDYPSCATFAPGSDRIALGNDDVSEMSGGGMPAGFWERHRNAVALIEPSTGKDVRLTGPTRPLAALAFTPDGRHLFTAAGTALGRNPALLILQPERFAEEDSLRQWDAATGKEIRKLPVKGATECVAVSPDGKLLISGGFDGKVRTWDVATGELVKDFGILPSIPTTFDFSRDGRKVMIAARKHVFIHDVATGREILTLRTCREHLRFPGSTRAVFGKEDRHALLVVLDEKEDVVYLEEWELPTAAAGSRVEGGDSIPPLVLDPGKTGSQKNPEEVMPGFDPKKNPAAKPVQALPREFVKARSFVIWDGIEFNDRFQKASDGRPFGTVLVSGTAFSTDRDQLLVGYSTRIDSSERDGLRTRYQEANFIALWNLAEGKMVRRFRPKTAMDPINALGFSADGRRAVSGTGHENLDKSGTGIEASIRLWDTETGQESAAQPFQYSLRWRGNRGPGGFAQVGCAAISPGDGSIAAATLADEIHRLDLPRLLFGASRLPFPQAVPILQEHFAIRIYDGKLQKSKRLLAGHTAPVHCLLYSPKGRHLFSAAGRRKGAGEPRLAAVLPADDTVRQWDMATGKEVRVFRGSEGPVRALALSPDGTFLVSGGDDEKIRCWDVKSGRQLHEFGGLKDRLLAAAFTDDGRQVAIGGYDGIHLCETVTGRKVATLRPKLSTTARGSARYESVAFAKGARSLYTVSTPFLLSHPQVLVEEWTVPQMEK